MGETFTMRTVFGRRHGWEIQKIMFGAKPFYRVTGRTWCRPATTNEITLWRAAKLPLRKGAKR